jgi:hypothetical protein
MLQKWMISLAMKATLDKMIKEGGVAKKARGIRQIQ